ncbi:phosphotransferase [bacterium]|nr:phosphotransferase [bacterium]
MDPHPYFALHLHSNEELAPLLPSAVIRRETLHEWPLSCVQRLHCEDGNTVIYKVQSAPSVEAEFYRQARSSLLVTAQILPVDDGPAALLLEDVDAPLLGDVILTAAQAVAHTEQILDQIAAITGDLPALNDIRSEDSRRACGEAILNDLHRLVNDGSFRQVNAQMIDDVAAVIAAEDVQAALHGETGYVHGDLRAENVLLTADGYRVLDWQRPWWGPVALDRLSLLLSLGVDPTVHVAVGVQRLHILLQIGWLAQCALHWFPPGVHHYDGQIAQLIGTFNPPN